MGLSLSDFYSLEPRAINKIMERRAEKIKSEHKLNFVSTLNAIGKMFVENYEYVDLFDRESVEEKLQIQASKETYTDEEQQALLDYFNDW